MVLSVFKARSHILVLSQDYGSLDSDGALGVDGSLWQDGALA
jgi:hypothetical protein